MTVGGWARAYGHDAMAEKESAFDEGLEPGECLIPLPGDEIEVFSGFYSHGC
jgi:hypothetical protein